MNSINNAKEIWVTDPSHKFSGGAPKENGSTVEIVLDNVTYTVIVENERWEWTPPIPLSEGDHVLSIRTIDKAGNIGAPTLRLLHVDTTAPDAPLILQVYDNTGSKTGMLSPGDITDDVEPTLKGVAEANSLVKIYDGGLVIGSVKADKNGYWQIDVELNEGEHQLQAEATDDRGHSGTKSEPFILTVEVRPEGIDIPPTIETIYDDIGPGIGDLAHGDYTNDNQPALSGSGVAGQTVNIFDNGEKIGSAVINAQGKWSFTPDIALEDGEHNLSVAHQGSSFHSPEWPLFIDTEAPEAPEINLLALDNLLAAADKGLFIANSKAQQLLIDGEDAVDSLHQQLNAEECSWVQQNGTVTVGGAQYHVYSNDMFELLVNEKIKTDTH